MINASSKWSKPKNAFKVAKKAHSKYKAFKNKGESRSSGTDESSESNKKTKHLKSDEDDSMYKGLKNLADKDKLKSSIEKMIKTSVENVATKVLEKNRRKQKQWGSEQDESKETTMRSINNPNMPQFNGYPENIYQSMGYPGTDPCNPLMGCSMNPNTEMGYSPHNYREELQNNLHNEGQSTSFSTPSIKTQDETCGENDLLNTEKILAKLREKKDPECTDEDVDYAFADKYSNKLSRDDVQESVSEMESSDYYVNPVVSKDKRFEGPYALTKKTKVYFPGLDELLDDKKDPTENKAEMDHRFMSYLRRKGGSFKRVVFKNGEGKPDTIQESIVFAGKRKTPKTQRPDYDFQKRTALEMYRQDMKHLIALLEARQDEMAYRLSKKSQELLSKLTSSEKRVTQDLFNNEMENINESLRLLGLDKAEKETEEIKSDEIKDRMKVEKAKVDKLIGSHISSEELDEEEEKE